MKTCGRCKTEKALEQFNKQNRVDGDGYQAYCKECNKAYMTEIWRKTKGKHIDPNRLTRWLDPFEVIDSGYGQIYYSKWAKLEKERIGNCKITKKDGLIAIFKE